MHKKGGGRGLIAFDGNLEAATSLVRAPANVDKHRPPGVKPAESMFYILPKHAQSPTVVSGLQLKLRLHSVSCNVI